jgi:hypothetical protein
MAVIYSFHRNSGSNLQEHPRVRYGGIPRSIWTQRAQRGISESFPELLTVEAHRQNTFVRRNDFPLRQVGKLRPGIVRHLRCDFVADVADGPVDCSGGILNDESFGRAVPDHAPAHGPAMAGSHFSAVHIVDSAFWNSRVVHQHGCGPALMWLNMTVSVENGIEHHVRALIARASDDIKKVISSRGTAKEEYLRAARAEVSGFGMAQNGCAVGKGHVFNRDAARSFAG